MHRSLLSIALVASFVAIPSAVWAQSPSKSQHEAMMQDAVQARDRARKELTQLRQEIQKVTGLVEVTPASVRQVIGRLQEQREELELDAAGAQGRRQALEEAVAELSHSLTERARDDVVATTLEKVVEVRKVQLQRLQEAYKQATVSRADIDAAEASLATAQAEVAAARQKATNGPAGESLDAWNRQLLESRVAGSEREARLAFIKKRLDQLSEALPALDVMEEQRASLAAAENAVAALESERRQLPEGYRPVRPSDVPPPLQEVPDPRKP